MKHKLMLGLLAMAALAAEAQTPQRVMQKPQEAGFTTLTSEDLVKLCKDADPDGHDRDSAMCLMYIVGFEDGYSVGLVLFNNKEQVGFCLPPGVTTWQMAKVVEKYGNDHPENLWLNAGVFIALALKDAYPCQKP